MVLDYRETKTCQNSFGESKSGESILKPLTQRLRVSSKCIIINMFKISIN